jgi:Alpha-L-fucosidase
VEIVAKGGNLLLGVGPKADGTLSDTVVQRLEEIGKWLDVNGAAIYNTRSIDRYRDGNVFSQGGIVEMPTRFMLLH